MKIKAIVTASMSTISHLEKEFDLENPDDRKTLIDFGWEPDDPDSLSYALLHWGKDQDGGLFTPEVGVESGDWDIINAGWDQVFPA
jgi:hypothetical protein